MAKIQDLESALVNAHKAGDTDAARKLASVITKARQSESAASRIPDAQPTVAGTVPEAPAPTMGERAVGAGEAGLTLATGATGGALGMLGGTLKGLAEQILSGQYGTPEAANLVQQSAMQGADALTYAPRTAQGQSQTAAVGDVLSNLVPVAAVLPGLAPAMAGTRAASPLRTTARAAVEGTARDVAGQPVAAVTARAIDSASRVADLGAQKITTLPRRALEALRSDPEAPTPGTQTSGGSAGTDMALQRRTMAESLPTPLQLTRGQASRDPAQLKFEVETAKLPDEGGRLRERYVQQNDAILRNIDSWIDQTGAEAPTLRAVGATVDRALVEQAARDKTRVRAAYAAANRSDESRALVDHSLPVEIGDGDGGLMSTTPIDYINSQPSGLPSTSVTDAARQYAVRLGVADLRDGQLVPRQATIRQMEAWRKAINESTGYEAPDIRQSTILKVLIDGQTEPVAGPLYQQARGIRARYAQNYENRATISKLLNTKRGTTDRLVAFEDVFGHAIRDGSLDDVRNVRRVLQRGGPEGNQAWRELQGQTLTYLRDQSTKSVAADSAGNRVISPAAFDKAVRELEVDGKLDFILGRRGAQSIRDLNEVIRDVKTVPPEAAINTSNTAATLAGLVDVVITGLLGGTPAPITTATRLAVKRIRDVKLRRRISDALDEAEARQAPGRRRPAVSDPAQDDPQQLPARTIH